MENKITISEVVATYRRPITTRPLIRNSEHVADLFRKIIDVDDTREHMIVFHLDGNHTVTNYNIAGVGTANRCNVHPRDVFQSALLNGAVSIVIAHNHPSGNCRPSQEDINVTHRMNEAAILLNITLLDHVIVTLDDCYSLRECGDFQPGR